MDTNIPKITVTAGVLERLAEAFLERRRAVKGRPRPSLVAERDMTVAFHAGWSMGYSQGLRDGANIEHAARAPGFKPDTPVEYQS